MFAFGGTGTEVVVAFTGWAVNITTETISAEQTDSNFGAGLATRGDVSRGGDVAIGAPSYVNGTVMLGAFSTYSFEVPEGGGSGVLEKRGSTIVGGYDTRGGDDTGFGSAIAYMGASDLVVCAPNDNTLSYEEPHGRCFVYSYAQLEDPDQSDWVKHGSAGSALNAFVGDSGDKYGSAVSGGCCVQDDEYSFFYAAGSPGASDGAGKLSVVAFNSEESIFEWFGFLNGESGSQDACGTSVASKGSIVAFGCPGAGANNNGLVRVVYLGDSGLQDELGSGIPGMDGDKLGDVNTIAVTSIATDPFDEDELYNAVSITVATASGVVKQFYFLNNEWLEMSNPYDNGMAGTKIAGADIDFEPSYVAISNPSGSQIIEFSYETPEPTQSPVATPAPVTPAPTDAPTTASSPTNPPVEPPTVPPTSAAACFNFPAIAGVTVGLWLYLFVIG